MPPEQKAMRLAKIPESIQPNHMPKSADTHARTAQLTCHNPESPHVVSKRSYVKTVGATLFNRM
jgi:hypothetical protein